ncbi:MAG: alpha/beta hydrolase [Anaerolineae bacterium]|nr:alpha/beta hydrolase [Anaerolineae bacterium]
MALYVQETGPDAAPTIVFLHGAGVAGWMWQPQVVDLARDYHCLVPDLPGHGQSPDVSPFTLADCTEQVADVIRQRAHGGKAHLVGLSMGASVALQMASQQPELVDHVLVSGPTAGPMPGLLIWLTRAMAPLTRMEWLLRMNARTLKVPSDLYEPFRQSQLRMNGAVLTSILEEINRFRVPEALRGVSVPVLAVVGQKEAGLNYRAARAVLAIMPDAVGRIAPQVRHIWNSENPDLFNRMVRAWITDTPLPGDLLPLNAS